MSSNYRVLCLSHDPSVIAADGDWYRPEEAEAAIRAGIDGHETCDLLIGRYSYPLVEVGCPETAAVQRSGQHRCYTHGGTRWADAAWLRILAVAQQQGEGSAFEPLLGGHAPTLQCWSPTRLQRLRIELGLPSTVVPQGTAPRVLTPCFIDHDCPSRVHATTPRGEARCISRYAPPGLAPRVVQCDRLHGHQGHHTGERYEWWTSDAVVEEWDENKQEAR